MISGISEMLLYQNVSNIWKTPPKIDFSGIFKMLLNLNSNLYIKIIIFSQINYIF